MPWVLCHHAELLCGAGMLLNLQGSHRGNTSVSAEGTSLLEALHVAGLGSHTACFSAAAVRELQAAEFPSDALWTDRVPELDSLAASLLVSACLGRALFTCNLRWSGYVTAGLPMALQRGSGAVWQKLSWSCP